MSTVRNLIKNKVFRVSLILIIITYPFYKDYELVYSVGDSMLPTYENGEILVVKRLSTFDNHWSPSRGQVIIAKDEENDSVTKRVVGVAGDAVSIKKGKIILNEEIYRDSISSEYIYGDQREVTVPEGYVWVIGDNRNFSWSGLIKISNIKGVALY